ncbi:jg18653 [Pararge aegeria aegeria]|uniref:Jg18653 protein n=1 Tax=Pararge aegeria aegeria TaxID=348720 RepID=A0A8S4R9J9_9NEOP|nr:jg18653 [Pararge aegeria aegeria]
MYVLGKSSALKCGWESDAYEKSRRGRQDKSLSSKAGQRSFEGCSKLLFPSFDFVCLHHWGCNSSTLGPQSPSVLRGFESEHMLAEQAAGCKPRSWQCATHYVNYLAILDTNAGIKNSNFV